MCEPPMITRHTSKMFVMEGQEVSLRCKSIGDPEPSTHWVSPDGKLIGNTSRTVCYENGSLDILKASVKVETRFNFYGMWIGACLLIYLFITDVVFQNFICSSVHVQSVTQVKTLMEMLF